MGPAGDICGNLRDPKDLRDLRDLKDLKDLKDLSDFRDLKDLRALKDPNSLLSRLLRAMWRPLRAKKRNLTIFNSKECKCGKCIEYICKIYVHIPMRF